MKRVIKIVAAVVIFFAVIGFFFGGGVEKQAQKNLDQIENQVAADAVRQYEIAKKNGNAQDAYTAASLCKAAFLQANDEENYAKWTKIEKEEAKKAGLDF